MVAVVLLLSVVDHWSRNISVQFQCCALNDVLDKRRLIMVHSHWAKAKIFFDVWSFFFDLFRFFFDLFRIRVRFRSVWADLKSVVLSYHRTHAGVKHDQLFYAKGLFTPSDFFWVRLRFYTSHGMGCVDANGTVHTVRLPFD